MPNKGKDKNIIETETFSCTKCKYETITHRCFQRHLASHLENDQALGHVNTTKTVKRKLSSKDNKTYAEMKKKQKI